MQKGQFVIMTGSGEGLWYAKSKTYDSYCDALKALKGLQPSKSTTYSIVQVHAVANVSVRVELNWLQL